MVSPKESIDAVSRAVANSGELPAEMTLLKREADARSDDADVNLPTMEVQISSIDDVNISNTDFVDFVTDDSGNEVGRIFLSEYELTIDIDLWTIEKTSYDPDDLGRRLKKALYPYSSYGPSEDFTDSDGNKIEQITYFRLGDAERADDLVQDPTVRKWSQTVELWAYESFRTTKDYIVSVDYPADGDLSSTQNDLQISDT